MTSWSSYEKNKNFSANTQMAAAILMSGSTFSQFEDALHIMDVNLVSERTFYSRVRFCIQLKTLYII